MGDWNCYLIFSWFILIPDIDIRWCKLTNRVTHTVCFNYLVLPNCGHPGSRANAVLVHSTYWAGEYVRYLCNPGYAMFGPAVRRCLPSGNWSGNGVQCKNMHVHVMQFISAYQCKVFNYSSKWWWIVVDIYWAAKWLDRYPPFSPTLRWTIVLLYTTQTE